MSATPQKSPLRLTTLFKEFFQSQQAAGVLLVLATLVSLVLANASFGEEYGAFNFERSVFYRIRIR